MLPKGSWWRVFGDDELNRLEEKALEGNQTLAAAHARLQQARALAAASTSATLPQVTLGGRVARQRISANRPLTNYASANFATTQNDFSTSLAASYEVDLAGRVQSLVNGASISEEQTAADLENTKLVMGADLATAYFSIRSLDADLEVLEKSIALQRRFLTLATYRHDLGATSGLETAQQQAQLDSTLVQVDLLKRQRSALEHAVATLTGTPASQSSVPVRSLVAQFPRFPLRIPSQVLEARPDVASAERAMAAANAQIGVAQAAFYPNIILGPSVGTDANQFEALLDAPSLLWSVGLSATQILFDGGRTKANVEAARAGYDVAVANYRRTVLVAMQEVEDGISGMLALERAYQQAQTSVQSAQRLLELATDRYEGGIASYLEVVTAQQSQVNSQRQAAQIAGQWFGASVFLIKAMGGRWQAYSSINGSQ
jgi:NodT family efflux transporter outer membrane factor (OMF) lipoprotein